MSTNKKTLVIGASEKPERYSNLAIHQLIQKGHEVIALGNRAAVTHGIQIQTAQQFFPDIHTITLYINPTLQKLYYDYIIALHPKRIIFNPGTENKELATLAKQNNIEPIQACTLVLLHTGQY